MYYSYQHKKKYITLPDTQSIMDYTQLITCRYGFNYRVSLLGLWRGSNSTPSSNLQHNQKRSHSKLMAAAG